VTTTGDTISWLVESARCCVATAMTHLPGGGPSPRGGLQHGLDPPQSLLPHLLTLAVGERRQPFQRAGRIGVASKGHPRPTVRPLECEVALWSHRADLCLEFDLPVWFHGGNPRHGFPDLPYVVLMEAERRSGTWLAVRCLDARRGVEQRGVTACNRLAASCTLNGAGASVVWQARLCRRPTGRSTHPYAPQRAPRPRAGSRPTLEHAGHIRLWSWGWPAAEDRSGVEGSNHDVRA
jgi:hypothetical protein